MSFVYPFAFTTFDYSLQWITRVARCYSGEIREVGRSVPRFVPSVVSTLEADEVSIALDILSANDGAFRFPDWRYMQRFSVISAGSVSSTLQIHNKLLTFAIGEQVMLFRSAREFEVVTIAADAVNEMTVTSPTVLSAGQYAWVVPLYSATLIGNANIDPIGGKTVSIGFTASVSDYLDLSSPVAPANFFTIFQGDPALNIRPMNTGSTLSFEPRFTVFDNETGMLSTSPLRRYHAQKNLVAIPSDTQAGLLAAEKVFHYLRGRAQQFWYSTWTDDFKIIGKISLSEIVLQLPVAENVAPNIDTLAFAYTDGTLSYHRVDVIASSIYSGITVRLIDPLPRNNLRTEEILTVSRASLQRLTSDRMTVTLSSGLQTVQQALTVEVPK